VLAVVTVCCTYCGACWRSLRTVAPLATELSYMILCRNDAVNPDLLLLPVIAISTSALSYMAVVPQGPSAAAGGTGSHAAGCRPA
jgi:hypothetical protein